MTALTALAVAGETRLVPLMTCDTVETETPASRATSAIVVTSPPEASAVSPYAAAIVFCLGDKLTYRNVCATVSMLPRGIDIVVESAKAGSFFQIGRAHV